MSRKPDLTKRVVALMYAIDKHAPTELPKTEEQVISLIQSLVRPIVRKVQKGARNATGTERKLQLAQSG